MNPFRLAVSTAALLLIVAPPVDACTGIVLQSEDGASVFGRTMEWGLFDMHSRCLIIPREQQFTSKLEDGQRGLTWKSKYGVVGIDALKNGMVLDGINEKGLTVGVFYHPGFAEYPTTEGVDLARCIGPADVCQFLLMTSSTVEEVKEAIASVTMVGVVEPSIGMAPPDPPDGDGRFGEGDCDRVLP